MQWGASAVQVSRSNYSGQQARLVSVQQVSAAKSSLDTPHLDSFWASSWTAVADTTEELTCQENLLHTSAVFVGHTSKPGVKQLPLPNHNGNPIS